jgi:hypothetical protein
MLSGMRSGNRGNGLDESPFSATRIVAVFVSAIR